MSLKDPIKVEILDQEYLIKGEEEVETVYQIAKYVNEKIKEVQTNSEGLSEKKIAILTALNIASEYFQLLKEKDNLSTNIKKRTESIIYNIDSVMG